MSLEQLGKRAGRMLANKMLEYLDEKSKAPAQPAKQWFPSQTPDHKANVASQYPGNVVPNHLQPQQPMMAPPLQVSCDSDDINALKFPDACNNTIPDFSRVGYREGHVRIPMVPVKEVLHPSSSDLCLEPDHDRKRIQDAIDRVAALPLQPIGKDGASVRGAVLLKAGNYYIKGALIINASGVVLRGEGQDENGTVITATGDISHDFVLVNGMLASDLGTWENQRTKAKTKEMMPTNGYKGCKKPDTYTRPGVCIPCGSTEIPVLDTKGYSVGDRIVIERPGCDEWLRDIGMDDLPARPDSGVPSTPWTPKSYTFRFDRRIIAIDRESSTFTIDIPMVMNLDPKYPPARIYGLVYKFNTISDVGVENLRLVSGVNPCHPNSDEKHGWYAIVLDNTVHGWVADVTTMKFVSGIFASRWSRYITIQDCVVDDPVSKEADGGRRYMYNLSGQMGLVKRCHTNSARHDFITLGRVCGPNVFVDSTGFLANNDSGPHERFAMGILYDNIACRTINVRQRLWMGSGQGWAGAFHVIYNCTTTADNNCFQDPPGTTNWIIGLRGGLASHPMFEGTPSKVVLHNRPHPIRSLYWWQLLRRMGGDVQSLERAVGVEGRMKYPPRQSWC